MTDQTKVFLPLHLMGYKEWCVIAAHICRLNGGEFTVTRADTEELEKRPRDAVIAWVDPDMTVHFKVVDIDDPSIKQNP